MALPDDLSPDRDLTEEHPRRSIHGNHLLALPHGVERLAEHEADAVRDVLAQRCQALYEGEQIGLSLTARHPGRDER